MTNSLPYNLCACIGPTGNCPCIRAQRGEDIAWPVEKQKELEIVLHSIFKRGNNNEGDCVEY